MKIQPLADRILVSPIEPEKVTEGGLYIPDNAKQKPQTGIVMAVGPGRVLDNGTTRTPDVTVGDKIIYGQYGGTEVTVEGETFLMMAADDVLGIFEEN